MRTYIYDDISTAQWMDILQDKHIMNDKMKMIISLLYHAPNYRLNAAAMTGTMGYTSHAPLNRIVGTCGQKIKMQYAIPASPKLTWHGHWLAVFNGDEELKNKFNWILKPNMIEAINQLQLFKQDPIFSTLLQKDSEAYYSITLEMNEGPITTGERTTLAKARIGQGKFRANLMQKYNGSCFLCGLNIPQLLVASHIKPWAHSNPMEKGDRHNGLLLCRNHDALFDQYLISFDKDGHIHIHDSILRADYEKLNLDETMHIEIDKKMRGYMRAHWEVFMNKMTSIKNKEF